MDFIQRLARAFLACGLALACIPALADYPATVTYYTYQNTASFQDSTAAGSCQKRISWLNGDPSWAGVDFTFISNTETSCVYQKSSNLPGYTTSENINKFYTCNGVVFAGTICPGDPPPPPCEAGCSGACGGYYKVYGTDYPPTGCIQGCKYSYGSGIQGSDGSYWVVQVGPKNGDTCTDPTPNSTSGTNTPEYDCFKQGMSAGTVNGTTVCVPAGTSGSTPTKTNEPNSSSTSSTSSTDSGGSTTINNTTNNSSTSTTFNGDGTVTQDTTSTTTNSDGSSSTKTETKTMPTSDFCRDNPKHAFCEGPENGQFGGSCAQGAASVNCEGDPILCAIAKEEFIANCKIFQDDPELQNKYMDAKMMTALIILRLWKTELSLIYRLPLMLLVLLLVLVFKIYLLVLMVQP